MVAVFMTISSLLFAAALPAKADDGPNGPHAVKPNLGFASWYNSNYGEMCWRDRSNVVNQFYGFVGNGAQERPDMNRVKAGAFKVLGADVFNFKACGDTEFGTLDSSIVGRFTYHEYYSVLYLATTTQNANTWYLNPSSTYNKKDNEKLDSFHPATPGDPAEQHLQYFNGKKWVSMWQCHAWHTLYDRTLEDITTVATRASEFDIPEADVLSSRYDEVNASTLFDGLCGKVPSKPGTYTFKLRMYTPTYDYIECKRSYATWYCGREYNNKKFVPLKGKVKLVKNKNGDVKVSYLSK